MSEIQLKGSLLGFEEYNEYALKDVFGSSSPFRLLACLQAPIAFVVVNPFAIFEDYSIEVDDMTVDDLKISGNPSQQTAVLCIARKKEESRCLVNLRSPLVINTIQGRFRQIVLQNDSYGVSTSFEVDQAENRP